VNKSLFGWVLFIALAVMLFMLLNKGQSQYAGITIDEFESRLKSDRVRVVTVENDKLLGEFNTAETIGDRGERVAKFLVPLPKGASGDWDLMQWLLDNRHSATIRVENNPNWLLEVLIPLIPWLLIFGFIWFFVFRQLRKSQPATAGAPADAVRVYVVNQPGEPPIASTAPTTATPPQPPPPPAPTTPAPGGDN